MTVHDALDHPWLREDRSGLDSRIPSERFDDMRKRIRNRYAPSPDPTIGLGRMADWSSLRKNKPQDYKIYNSFWGKSISSFVSRSIWIIVFQIDVKLHHVLPCVLAMLMFWKETMPNLIAVLLLFLHLLSLGKKNICLNLARLTSSLLGIVTMLKFVNRQNISRNMIEIIIN